MFTITVTNLYADGSKQPSTKYQIKKSKISIGRDQKNDLVLRQTNVSTKHATLKLTRRGFVLTDNNSTNGVYVNQQRILEPIIVTANDDIRIGGSIIELSGHPSLGEASPQKQSQAAGASKRADSSAQKSGRSIRDAQFANTPRDSATAFPYGGADGASGSGSSPLSMLLAADDAKKIVENFSKSAPIPPKKAPRTPSVATPSASAASNSMANLSFLLDDSPYKNSSSSASNSVASDFPDISQNNPFPQNVSAPPSIAHQAPAPVSNTSSPPLDENAEVIISVELTRIGSPNTNSLDVRKFAQSSVSIGRAPNNTLALQCKRTSGHHAMVEYKNGQLYITDMQSSNGTFVNDDRISSPHIITSNDRICIGSYFMVIDKAIAPQHQIASPEPIPASSETTAAVPFPIPNSQAAPFPVAEPQHQAAPFPVSEPQHQAASFPIPQSQAAPFPVSNQPDAGFHQQQQSSQPVQTPIAAQIDNINQVPVNVLGKIDPSFWTNFHSIFIHLKIAKDTLSETIDRAQDLGVKQRSKVQSFCGAIASVIKEQYSLHPQFAQVEPIQNCIDNCVPKLMTALALAAQHNDLHSFIPNISRALSLLYPFSTQNATHPSGPISLPLLSVFDERLLKQEQEKNQNLAEQRHFQHQTNSSYGLLVSRFTLKVDYHYLKLISAISQAISHIFYFDEELTFKLEIVLDEAFSNIIEHAYEVPSSGYCSISFYTNNSNELNITIDDQGFPIDIQKMNSGAIDGPGHRILKTYCKRVQYVDLGHLGKRLVLSMNLPERFTGVFSSPPPRLDEFIPITSSSKYNVGPATPELAAEIPRCLFRSYEYTYFDARYYQLNPILEAISNGTQISAIALTEKQVGVGHLALALESSASKIGNLEALFVVPQLRTSNMVSKLSTYLLEKAQSMGLCGLTYHASTKHPYEQVAFRGLGAITTGIMLAYFPATDPTISQVRAAAVCSILPLNPIGPSTVFAPDYYASVLQKIYESLNIQRQIATQNVGQETQPEASDIGVFKNQSQLVARLKIRSYGKDCISVIDQQMSNLIIDNYACIHIDVPIIHQASQHIIPQLRSLGFFFGSLIPATDIGDVLRMQFVNQAYLSPNQVSANDATDKLMLDFIFQDRQNSKGHNR